MTDDGDPTGGGAGAPAPSGGQAPPPKNDGGEKPPWGDDFDPERAWKTIQNLRKQEDRAKELERENIKLTDATKSESERNVAERDRATARAEAAESRLLRLEVAAELEIPAKYAARLVGTTRQELENDAKQMIEDLGLQAIDGQRRTTSFDPGVRSGGGGKESMNDMMRRVAGRR